MDDNTFKEGQSVHAIYYSDDSKSDAADGKRTNEETACGREGGAAPYQLKPFHYTTTDS